MAYFPNGSAGIILDNQCCECLHERDDVTMCPVYFVQATYNYSQNDNENLESCLNYLIDEHGICQMKKALDALNLLKPELADTRSELEKWEADRR